MWQTRALNVASSGAATSRACCDPPAMIVSVPCSAAAAPPEMPASTNSTSRSHRAAWIFTDRARRGGAEVDHDLPRARALEQPAIAEHDRLDGGGVGQREEDDVGLGGERRDRIGAATPDAETCAELRS